MNRLWRVLLVPLRLDEPPSLPRDLYWRTVWAVLLLGVSLGLQATVIAMMAFGPLAPDVAPGTLTSVGQANVRPEWDLPAFQAGCVLTLGLCVVLVQAWNARLRRADGARAARPGAWLHAGLALASAGAFAALAEAAAAGVDEAFRLPVARLAPLALPAAAAALILLAHHVRGRRP